MIFLAELGDKTQLAVMSQSGVNGNFKLTVFAAGALALTASTAVGVLAGGLLQRLVPDERYLKVAGGIVFLLFGFLMLRQGLMAPRCPVALSDEQPVRSLLGRLAMRQALAFERAAINDYRALVRQTQNRRLQELFATIASEEELHRKIFGRLEPVVVEDQIATVMPHEEELLHDVAIAHSNGQTSSEQALLQHAIAHERATAAFYRALAQGSSLPSLRRAFQQAAGDEERHARMMEQMLTELG